MKKTFISFDNLRSDIKDYVQSKINSYYNMKDYSLNYEIDSENDEYIRQKIRDEYITDATVLVVIATIDAKGRKFIDWEIAASMYDGEKRIDGKRNDICGIVVIDCIGNEMCANSKKLRDIYDNLTGNTSWVTLKDNELRNRISHLPNRIVESLVKGADITIIPYKYINDLLEEAIIHAHNTKENNKGKYIYTDLRKHNSPRKENIDHHLHKDFWKNSSI